MVVREHLPRLIRALDISFVGSALGHPCIGFKDDETQVWVYPCGLKLTGELVAQSEGFPGHFLKIDVCHRSHHRAGHPISDWDFAVITNGLRTEIVSCMCTCESRIPG